MKRRDFSALGLSATGTGQRRAPHWPRAAPSKAGISRCLSNPLAHSHRASIEVIEFFWYGCQHCYAFEPLIEPWAKQVTADVAFRKAHVAFRASLKPHQRMFYALEALGKEAQARPAIFAAMHQQGQSLDDPKVQAKFLANLGVDAAKYLDAYNSFGVQTKCTAGRPSWWTASVHRRRAGTSASPAASWTSPCAVDRRRASVMPEVESGVRALAGDGLT